MNEATLTKFILSYLVDKPDYVELDTEQQQLIFQTSLIEKKAQYLLVQKKILHHHLPFHWMHRHLLLGYQHGQPKHVP